MPPQESSSSAVNQSVDLRVQAKAHTSAGETYFYLIRNPEWSSKRGKAMLSQAAQDYWLPYARLSTDLALAKTTAIACIERLEYQIAKLRQDFGLKPSDRAQLEQSELIGLMIQLTNNVQLIPPSLAEISVAIASVKTTQPAVSASLAAAPDTTAETAVENIYTQENMQAVLDMIGPLGEDLSADPNA